VEVVVVDKLFEVVEVVVEMGLKFLSEVDDTVG
jgi:hypothetical protein